MSFVELDTKCGKIKGLSFDTHNEFRGIRYASSARWEYPIMVEKWDGVYDATQFGACAIQRRSFEEDSEFNPFYYKEFREGKTFTYSEDCLFLNIWAPKDAQNCPVIVYIHGGSFTGGSADEKYISGAQYAKNNVIFVAMNYRVGPFGFCSHPDLTNEDGICGNYGLYDQYVALKWIKENIAAFGGDADKLTLLGQSAGAMSVDIQLSNPMLKRCFAGAALLSGVGIQRAIAKPLKPEKTEPFWRSVIENANVNDIWALKEVDDKTLFYAWLKAYQADFKNIVYSLPVVDGGIIKENNFNMNTIPDMPYIIGVTTADMAPIALERLAQRFAKKCENHHNPCYVYNFARDLPGDNVGAWHSSDLPYAFATLDNGWRPYETVDFEISNQMLKSLVAFARTGDPNCNAVPAIWRPGYKKPMRFCEETKAKSWPTTKIVKNTIIHKGPI